MKIKFLIIFILSVVGYAQDSIAIGPPASSPVKEYDPGTYQIEGLTYTSDILDTLGSVSTATTQRKFSTALEEKYNSEDYNYSLTQPKESLWSRIERVLQEFFAKIFDFDDISDVNNFTEWVMKGIAVLIIGLVLYWLIKFLIGKEGNFFFSKRNKELNIEAQTIQENIHKIDFNKIIAEYELEKNYRYAVRYQFLHLLKIFTDNNLITWDPDKTNADYIAELTGKAQQSAFTQLVKVFNYVWYGDFDIKQEDYQKVKASFQNLKQRTNE